MEYMDNSIYFVPINTKSPIKVICEDWKTTVNNTEIVFSKKLDPLTANLLIKDLFGDTEIGICKITEENKDRIDAIDAYIRGIERLQDLEEQQI